MKDLLNIVKFSRTRERSFKDVITKTLGLYPVVRNITQSELEKVLTPKHLVEVYEKGFNLLKDGIDSKTYADIKTSVEDTAEAHNIYSDLKPDYVFKAACTEAKEFLKQVNEFMMNFIELPDALNSVLEYHEQNSAIIESSRRGDMTDEETVEQGTENFMVTERRIREVTRFLHKCYKNIKAVGFTEQWLVNPDPHYTTMGSRIRGFDKNMDIEKSAFYQEPPTVGIK